MSRWFGSLTSDEVKAHVTKDSILVLPIGSYEQHGAHLPLHTDTIIAERFSERVVERYAPEFDLWLLPSVPFGLAQEHAWSAGTISLGATLFLSVLDGIVSEFVRATAARRLLVVNGHGGNRGILEASAYELRRDHGIRVCVIHPSALAAIKNRSEMPEVHAGLRETSVMMTLAPEQVRLEQLESEWGLAEHHVDAIRRFVLDRGVTWPWDSQDPRIAYRGATGGDPREGTQALGDAVIEGALANCREVLEQL